MKFDRRKWIRSLPWMFFGMVVLLTVYMDGWIAKNILDGDASQPFLRGWVSAQEGNLFTNNLYLTTEVGLLNAGTVAALLFSFISDWTFVRILTMLVMQTWYVLTFLYLCRQLGVRFPQAIAVAGMMLLPLSIPYARIVLYHMYYLHYAANVFLILGLIVRLLRTSETARCRRTWLLLGGCWLVWTESDT